MNPEQFQTLFYKVWVISIVMGRWLTLLPILFPQQKADDTQIAARSWIAENSMQKQKNHDHPEVNALKLNFQLLTQVSDTFKSCYELYNSTLTCKTLTDTFLLIAEEDRNTIDATTKAFWKLYTSTLADLQEDLEKLTNTTVEERTSYLKTKIQELMEAFQIFKAYVKDTEQKYTSLVDNYSKISRVTIEFNEQCHRKLANLYQTTGLKLALFYDQEVRTDKHDLFNPEVLEVMLVKFSKLETLIKKLDGPKPQYFPHDLTNYNNLVDDIFQQHKTEENSLKQFQPWIMQTFKMMSLDLLRLNTQKQTLANDVEHKLLNAQKAVEDYATSTNKVSLIEERIIQL